MDNDSLVYTVQSEPQEQKIDLLDRQGLVDQIVNLLTLLSDRSGSSTFALDGKWGTGKTFVLNMLENTLLQQAAGTRFSVFRYNCWKYNYYEEPLVAIVASMLDSVDSENHLLSDAARENLKQTFAFCKPTLQKIASEVSKNKLGVDVIELLSSLKENQTSLDEYLDSENANRSYDNYYSFNKTLKNAREELRKLTKDKSLVVIVDELDRCQPNYAIKVLERLHHMFSDIENCSVVLAIDKEQLAHTIKQVFGDGANTNSYLKKFIDFEFTLDTGRANGKFIAKYPEYFSMFDENAITTKFSFEEFLTELFADIDIRTQEHLMDRITTIHRLLFPEDKDKKDYSFMCFELMLLVLTGYYSGCADAEFVWKENCFQIRFFTKNKVPTSFASYVKNKWRSISYSMAFRLEQYHQIVFPSPIDIPELLILYQGQMVNGEYKYFLDDSDDRYPIYEAYIEDFKKVRELLQIIK